MYMQAKETGYSTLTNTVFYINITILIAIYTSLRKYNLRYVQHKRYLVITSRLAHNDNSIRESFSPN